MNLLRTRPEIPADKVQLDSEEMRALVEEHAVRLKHEFGTKVDFTSAAEELAKKVGVARSGMFRYLDNGMPERMNRDVRRRLVEFAVSYKIICNPEHPQLVIKRFITKKFEGNLEVAEPCQIESYVTGDIKALSGSLLILKGVCMGNVSIKEGGKAVIDGDVIGDVTNEGGSLEFNGTIHGNLYRSAGRTEISQKSRLGGKILS